MKKISVIAVIAAAFLVVPAFAAKEKDPSKDKGLSKAERLAVFQKEHRAEFDKKKNFIQSQHDKKMGELKARLAASPKLTADQKAALTSQLDKQFEENMAFRQAEFEKTQNYVRQIATDPGLTPEARRAALEKYRQDQIAEVQERFKNQRARNQDILNSLKS